MTAVGSVGAPRAIATPPAVGRGVAPAASSSVLPPPSTAGLDPSDMLCALQAQDQQLGTSQGVSNVQAQQAVKDKAVKDQLKQIHDAIEASQHHSFWDDVGSALGTIGQVCAVVGSVAVAVASCGAGTVVAALAISACVLSTASVAESQFHVLEDLGVDPDAASWIGMGLAVGGAVLSLGAGAAASGAELSADATTTTEATNATQKGTMVVQGAADIGKGAAKIASANAQADELEYEANAKADKARATVLQRGIDMLIDNLADSNKEAQRRYAQTQQIVQTYGAAQNAAVITGAS